MKSMRERIARSMDIVSMMRKRDLGHKTVGNLLSQINELVDLTDEEIQKTLDVAEIIDQSSKSTQKEALIYKIIEASADLAYETKMIDQYYDMSIEELSLRLENYKSIRNAFKTAS